MELERFWGGDYPSSGAIALPSAQARALLTQPAVVVLDEPTLGVDVQSRAALWERIRQIAGAGKTVLLTTNYMEEAQALADTLTILDRGRLVAQGAPADLQQQIGGGFIEVEADFSPEDLAALQRLPGTSALAWDAPRVRLSAADSRQLMARVVAYLYEARIEPRAITMRQPNLNDVFLDLTGRALRD